MQGLELVKQGYIWRIGDVSQVQIWSDPWIPMAWSRQVITPRGANLLTHVSELICPISGTWDERLVRDTFWPDDARHILQIPLREGVDDFTAWHYNHKGEHSVKSAYKLHTELTKQTRNGAPGGSSNMAGQFDKTNDPAWKRIWKLPCPRKIQLFVWRMKHEALALCNNLVRRGMKLEQTKCFFCGRAEEDGGHLFIKCKAIKEVWRELALEKERMELEHIEGVHAMLDYLWALDEKKRVHIVTLWWNWWNNRNKVREGKLPTPAASVARFTRSSSLEYLQYFHPKVKQVPMAKWNPPPPVDDMLKVNLDGAFVPGNSFSGWGVVVRDGSGQIITAKAGRKEHVHDAFAAEVNAMVEAVATAADLDAIRVVFETDSQLLADALDLRKVDSSQFAAAIEDIKFQLKMWFSKQFSVCRREANSVAHELAKIGRMCLPNNCIDWDSSVPPQVAVCASGDLPEHR